MLKLGIDNGNYNTKSSERLLYASGFTVGTAPTIDIGNQLYYNGRYYAIGDKRMNVQNDKAADDDVFILSLPAIADAMRKAGTSDASIVMGVGLPIGVFGTQKDAFRHYFLRKDIRFEYADQSYHCDVLNCKVFPQGYAALCRHYKLLERYTSVTLADIGG